VKKPEPKTEPAQKADLTVDEGNLLRQLDEAVRDILALNAGAEASKWLLGKKIAEVFHSEGWRLRRDQEGEQSYRGFNQFVVTEIGIDPSTAYRYMDISKRFTEEQAKKLGTHKVVALLRVSDEAEQKKLIEKIEREGLSSREVQAEVKRLNLPRRETGRREMPDGAPGRRALPAGAIAAALTLGVKNLGLMKRDDPTQKAKAIVDLPTCRLDLDNGVVMEFTILEGSAGLVLKVDVKKEDPLSEV
jgi:hypothetical protein